jgi:tetratricopeptide (TPR) repeat protein
MYDFSKRKDLTDFSNAKNGFSECYKLSDKLAEEYKDRDPEKFARSITNTVRARTALANLLLDNEECSDEARSTLETALEKASGNDSLLAEVNTLLCWHYLKRKDYNNSIIRGELAVKLADNADGQINLNEARLALGQAYHHIANAEKRVQNLKPVLSFKYTREPLSYEDAVKEFYEKHNLDLKELF